VYRTASGLASLPEIGRLRQALKQAAGAEHR